MKNNNNFEESIKNVVPTLESFSGPFSNNEKKNTNQTSFQRQPWKKAQLNKRKLFFLKKFNFKNSKIIIPTIIINNQYLTLEQAIKDTNNQEQKKYTFKDINWYIDGKLATYKITKQIWIITLFDKIKSNEIYNVYWS